MPGRRRTKVSTRLDCHWPGDEDGFVPVPEPVAEAKLPHPPVAG